MPRLDGGDSSSHSASAYPRQRFSPFRVMLYFMMFLSLRNILTKNYRNEEISYLRSSGNSEEEIEKFVPKTQLERDVLGKKKTVDQLQLMREVELLKEQVKELRMQVFNETGVKKSAEKVSAGEQAAEEKVKSIELMESREFQKSESEKA
eukprot:CCRYP_018512-RA/>CCRYP_018512-RA protein AED:0.06 eAED:0.06 QI:213/1/1/1/1/1/3/819/149